jgi:hypothetical protein
MDFVIEILVNNSFSDAKSLQNLYKLTWIRNSIDTYQ